MCDMPVEISVRVFKSLNGDNIQLKEHSFFRNIIVTDIEPKDLIYPEGWYYAKGYFENKYTSSTGIYRKVPMRKLDGTDWGDVAKYCTLLDD